MIQLALKKFKLKLFCKKYWMTRTVTIYLDVIHYLHISGIKKDPSIQIQPKNIKTANKPSKIPNPCINFLEHNQHITMKKGFRCILSDQATRYLDHLDAPWNKFHNTEPLLSITDPDDQRLVIGGAVSMWGETVDESNM